MWNILSFVVGKRVREGDFLDVKESFSLVRMIRRYHYCLEKEPKGLNSVKPKLLGEEYRWHTYICPIYTIVAP